MAVLLIRSTSPRTKTRSQGTRTSSKNTTQSISSKRDASGWSKRERPRSKLSRQRNFSPGVPHGMAKLMAKGLCFSVCLATRGEYTAISSDIGPSVARTRAPRTTMPASVSRTTLTARRRHVRHLVAQTRLVLHVVQRSDGTHAVGEAGVRGHVLDALAAQPDLALLILQALDVLPPGPRAHVGAEENRPERRSG